MMNKKEIIKNIVEIIIVFLVVTYIFHNVFIPIKVNGTSMYPTLYDKDFGLVNALHLDLNQIERFDIVVLQSEELDERIIKRVIGLPGETVVYKDDQLYIDGSYYQEYFLDQDYIEEIKKVRDVKYFTEDFEITVEKDEIFVMGDNRIDSLDSRLLGCFKADDLVGINGIIVYPFSHAKWLK